MDLDLAIAVHRDWKERLEAYVAKPDESLSPDIIASVDHCELGLWLAEDGAAHRELPAFERLVTAHRAFHEAAGAIVLDANQGKSVMAAVRLGSGSDYARRSSEVIRAIMVLRDTLRRFTPSR